MATFPKRACLTGRDIAKLLNGECISAFGTEFVYDGDGASEVSNAAENFKRKAGPTASYSSQTTARPRTPAPARPR